MKHTITIAPDVVRARVKAMVALHAYMDNPGVRRLSDDDDPALNQAMSFAFGNAVAKLVPWTENMIIEPTNFYDNPDDLLSMSVDFCLPDGVKIDWSVAMKSLEEYLSDYVMAEMLPHCKLGQLFMTRANESLSSLIESITLPQAGSLPRIRRTI